MNRRTTDNCQMTLVNCGRVFDVSPFLGLYSGYDGCFGCSAWPAWALANTINEIGDFGDLAESLATDQIGRDWEASVAKLISDRLSCKGDGLTGFDGGYHRSLGKQFFD